MSARREQRGPRAPDLREAGNQLLGPLELQLAGLWAPQARLMRERPARQVQQELRGLLARPEVRREPLREPLRVSAS